MGADGYELLWGDRERRPRGRPAALSRERIVAEAVAVADADGLEKVSMKRVADRLDCGVMSLYRHVPGKAELVLLMFDSLMADPPEIPTDSGWRPAMTAWAQAVRDLFRAHPWALSMVTDHRPMGPNEAAWVDTALGVFDGLQADLALSVVLAVDCYVVGAVRPEASGRDGEARIFGFLTDPETRRRFPNLARLVTEVDIERSDLLAGYFDFGLERLLDGIERHIGS